LIARNTSSAHAFLSATHPNHDNRCQSEEQGRLVGVEPCSYRELLVVADGRLLAGIEFKSQVGSFGNNYNNRTEESIGSAVDLWAAYREGAFKLSARPWLGYLMLLEEAPGSIAPVRAREPHFKVFPEFADASYARRYQVLLTKLVRERLYDAACFLMSSASEGARGVYREPTPELSFENFLGSLLAKAIAVARVKE